MSAAQTMYAIGAAAPSPAATNAGSTKMPAPMVTLMMLAVRSRTPMARTNPASLATLRSLYLNTSTEVCHSGHSACVDDREHKSAGDTMSIGSLKDLYLDELADLYD